MSQKILGSLNNLWSLENKSSFLTEDISQILDLIYKNIYSQPNCCSSVSNRFLVNRFVHFIVCYSRCKYTRHAVDRNYVSIQHMPYDYYVVFVTVFCSPVRFLDDVEVMLKWRPPAIYKYMWKYVCLLAMVGLLTASLLRMFFKWPTYTAWNHTTVKHTAASCSDFHSAEWPNQGWIN